MEYLSLERVDFIGNQTLCETSCSKHDLGIVPLCSVTRIILGSLVTLLALVSRYKALLQLVLRRKCMVEMGTVMQFICLKSENPDHCRRPLTADCQSSIAQLRRVVRP